MELFLKLLDKLIDLLKVHKENKSELFKDIVEPLYNEFEKVAVQYFALFRSVLKDIADAQLDDIIDKIEMQRNDYIQARIKIVNISEIIKQELENTDILEFCNAMKAFFFVDDNKRIIPKRLSTRDVPHIQKLIEYAQQQKDNSSRGSMLLHLLEEYLEEQGFEKESSTNFQYIVLYIESGLKSMEDSWGSASRLYAKLRINYLLSKQL